MNARASTFMLLGALLVLGAVTVTWRHHPTTAPSPRAEPSSPSLPTPRVERSGDYVEHDPAIVFQRAFWRYLGPDVQVLEAERRESVDPATQLGRWQWFIALQTTPEFRGWLLEQNPFELVRANNLDTFAETPPAWFPTADASAAFTLYRNPEGRLHLLLDAATGRIYATDSGGGFAAPQRSLVSN